MKNKPLISKLFIALFCVVLLVSAAFLTFIFINGDAEIVQKRSDGGFRQIKNATCEEFSSPGTPLGVVTEYRFRLSETFTRDEHLAFYAVHQYAEVYIDEELVYSLKPSKNNPYVKTVGSNWIMIPLYYGDAGKEVRVVITPVYESYRDFQIEFLSGCGLDIYIYHLTADLFQMVICGITILCGIMLIGIGCYWFCKKKRSGHIISLGISAVTLGIWRLFDMKFSPLLAPNKTVFLFCTSLTMLMITAIPLVNSLKNDDSKRNIAIVNCYCLVGTLLYGAQVVLQILGIFDFRETLPISHFLIVVGAGIVVGSLFYEKRPHPAAKNLRILSLVFVVGALTDLLIFYLARNSFNLLFTVLAFFCYVLFTGMVFIFSYSEKERQLKEKETQLTQSRITMMLSQIRSHFVFNILNAISGMCKYNPEMADQTVVCFARYLRTNIDIMHNDAPVSFHSALRHIEDYVSLEQIRFGDHINFIPDIQVDKFVLPPLILQPIIENAIRHGLNPKPEGGTVILRTREDEENILIEIQDDGVGFHAEELNKSKSVGLSNVRFRLKNMVNGTMKIDSTPGVGTTVTIAIPREKALLEE